MIFSIWMTIRNVRNRRVSYEILGRYSSIPATVVIDTIGFKYFLSPGDGCGKVPAHTQTYD